MSEKRIPKSATKQVQAKYIYLWAARYSTKHKGQIETAQRNPMSVSGPYEERGRSRRCTISDGHAFVQYWSSWGLPEL